MENNNAPFPLAYLDWCKKVKEAKSIQQTQNRAWIREFYYSDEWGKKDVNGVDYAIALGANL